jgi:hypothetical protein
MSVRASSHGFGGRVELLILDDWGLAPLTSQQGRDLHAQWQPSSIGWPQLTSLR